MQSLTFVQSTLLVFLGWCTVALLADATAKEVLSRHPRPALLTCFQFFASYVVGRVAKTMSGTPSSTVPQLTVLRSKPFLLLVLSHTLGYLVTNVSISKLQLAFLQTVKGTQPLFTALIMRALGVRYSWSVVACLSVVSLGIALGSIGEMHLSIVGLFAGIFSNLFMSTRDTTLKHVISQPASDAEEDSSRPAVFSDQEETYILASKYSMILLVPFTLYFEGAGRLEAIPKCVERDPSCAALVPRLMDALPLYLLNGTLHLLYNLLSCEFLSRVQVLTHSVANVGRRVFGILAAVIFMGNRVSFLGSVGIVLVFAGVVSYSAVSEREGRRERAITKGADTSLGSIDVSMTTTPVKRNVNHISFSAAAMMGETTLLSPSLLPMSEREREREREDGVMMQERNFLVVKDVDEDETV